jgi:hypothetical protein
MASCAICPQSATVTEASGRQLCADHGWPDPPIRSLKELVLRSIERPQRPRLRISQAGRPCARELWYVLTSAPAAPTKPEALVKMALGSALDEYALKPMPGLGVHRGVSITMGELTIDGTDDVEFYELDDPDGKPWMVSDLKCVGIKTWAKIQQGPKQEHRAQVNLYAYGRGAKRWSVCYVNVDTGDIHEHFGDMDEFAARRDFGLFEEVNYWLKRGEPPPRPYEDIEEEDGTVKLARTQYPCNWCAYKATCWPAQEKETNDVAV